MPQMGMMGGMGAMNGMQMGAMNAMGQMNGFQSQGGNNQADNSTGGDGGNNSANQNIMSNPAFGGFAPAMGGFQGGFPMAMAGMGMPGMGMGGAGMMGSVLGNANLLGAPQMGVKDEDGNDASSSNNPMAQQNMLMAQLQAAAGAGSIWQQYGMQGADGGMMGAMGGIPTSSYLSMLGQGAGAGGAVPGGGGGNREAGDTGVFQSGAIPDFAKSGKKSRPKKPKNKPKRPLSAYNLFFKDERAKILSNIPDKPEEDEEGASGEDGEKAIKKEEGEDGGAAEEGEKKKPASGKKRKRVPHGKIGFESLAKIVGQRWKELPPEDLEQYKKRAEEDMKRYRKEMEAYVQKQREGLEQSREHLEKLVDEETKKRYFGDAATSGGV
jgi:HMG (high mobility group) box